VGQIAQCSSGNGALI